MKGFILSVTEAELHIPFLMRLQVVYMLPEILLDIKKTARFGQFFNGLIFNFL